MRIDLPCCDFSNCRKYFDGNCTAHEGHRYSCEYLLLQTKQLTNGWIPSKLRQPTNEESIERNGEFVIQSARVKLPHTATWNRGKKLWQDGEGYQLDYVIAWQQLPEKYIAD